MDRIRGIVQEIERQKLAKRDYVYPIHRLGFTDSGLIVLSATNQTFVVADRHFIDWESAEKWLEQQRAEGVDGADDWSIRIASGSPEMQLNPTALRQLLSKMGIPKTLYDRLKDDGHGDLNGHLLRELMDRTPTDKCFLLRTMDGHVRAVLSDRYKLIDNADLFFLAAEVFQGAGAELWDARLWDDGFELHGVAPHISGEVTLDRTFDPGDGWQSRWVGGEGDVHNAAVRVRNSETGHGSCRVDMSILRRVCANLCVWSDGVSVIHAGGKIAEGVIKSDRTKELESEVVWSTIRDAVTTAFDEKRFSEYIERLNAATQVELPCEPRHAVDALAASLDLSVERKDAILAQLLQTGDRTKFGVIQAVTASAHDAAPAIATELEELGARLLDMHDQEFLYSVGG